MAQKIKGAISSEALAEAIGERKEFESNGKGTLWGVKVSQATFSITTGKLPAEVAQKLHQHIRRGEVTFVVYSRHTPIGWDLKPAYGRSGFEVPQIKYTPATTRHQNMLRRIWGV